MLYASFSLNIVSVTKHIWIFSVVSRLSKLCIFPFAPLTFTAAIVISVFFLTHFLLDLLFGLVVLSTLQLLGASTFVTGASLM